MTLFLTPDELRELTAYTRPSKQIEWLTREGFTFRVAADGHPRVLRDHANRIMDQARGKKNRIPTEPDFSTMVA